jgi:hypothetical protein
VNAYHFNKLMTTGYSILQRMACKSVGRFHAACAFDAERCGFRARHRHQVVASPTKQRQFRV